MYHTIQQRVRERVSEFLKLEFGIEHLDLKLEIPPQVEFGEVALPVAFDLAKRLKKPPRVIAQHIAETIGPLDGIEKIVVAGGGYINLYLQRSNFFALLSDARLDQLETSPRPSDKVIVEHTNINPNKSAHIGHLRNAALGDSFVRLLRFLGRTVEVQNYIDNTGVQVADVVVGFEHIVNLSKDQVASLIDDPQVKFDFYCWDLYARVSHFYEEDPSRLSLRAETLHNIERGGNPTSELGDLVATAIVRAHIATMLRLNIQYDLMPRESDILHLKFWEKAFNLLKENGAIVLESEGKNRGCWVMKGIESTEKDKQDSTTEESYDEDKVIVRSNGTVTYVGKDIAYQLWKFGLLGKNFFYRKFHVYKDGHVLWMSSSQPGTDPEPSPRFGGAREVYNVIDVRQAYLQNIVVQGLRALGFNDAADHSIHFDYEMVALSPRCCADLGIDLSAEDRKRPYVEVSGRKGLGVKADQLIDQLIAKALLEVEKRHSALPAQEQERIARQIAVGGLRYFLLKYTLHSVIAFDFDEALSFEGETGPYIQYAVVRSKNIFRKYAEEKPAFSLEGLRARMRRCPSGKFLDGAANNEVWGLILLASQLGVLSTQAVASREPAVVAKYAFALAQHFNNFYHKHRILPEPDPERKEFLLMVVDIVMRSLEASLSLLGIEVPEKM
ncbi:MAG: arginine--tRNA ligase [Acidobacteriia bacterium]|nr:arginine--tRNA ligase [Terriglobia bacterium]